MSIPPSISQFRSQIESALRHAGDSHTFDDVCEMVASKRLQFWPGPNSVIVTELIQYPQHKTLHFFLAGGDLAELEVMTPGILEWGQEQGCSRASLVGRRGWERTFLARSGWQHRLVVMEKVL